MNEFLCIVKEFQQLIAGLFTILAAVIAWFAIMRPAEHNTETQQQVAAAALWAELLSIGARLHADMKRFQRDHASSFQPESLNTAIFDADPLAVGRLPADEAFMIVQVYKLILDLNDRYKKYQAHHSGVETNALALDVHKIEHQIGVVLRGFYETAGIPIEKANAALKIWTTVIEK